MFPLSASGTVSSSGDLPSTSAVIKELTERLARCKPTSLSVHDDIVNVEAGPLRLVLSSNLQVAISRGAVKVRMTGNENSPVSHLVVFVFFFWLFLVGGNYLWSVYQFRWFLRKTLHGI